MFVKQSAIHAESETGEPGTGKTLTAECVCERLKRPLYIVNGGELGMTAESVQGKLKEILALSARWNAIVLIDEADVFLESRNGAGIHRNSLVSGKSSPSRSCLLAP